MRLTVMCLPPEKIMLAFDTLQNEEQKKKLHIFKWPTVTLNKGAKNYFIAKITCVLSRHWNPVYFR